MQNPLGNHLASYFHRCHTRILDFSTQVPFNFETSDAPRTLHTYPSSFHNNLSVQNEVMASIRSRRTERTPVGHQNMKSFNCMLTLISVLESAVDLSLSTIGYRSVLGQSNAIWYGKSIVRRDIDEQYPIMSEYFVVFNVLDQNLGSAGSQSSQDSTNLVVLQLFGHVHLEHLPSLFAFTILPQQDPSYSKGFLYCWYCAKYSGNSL